MCACSEVEGEVVFGMEWLPDARAALRRCPAAQRACERFGAPFVLPRAMVCRSFGSRGRVLSSCSVPVNGRPWATSQSFSFAAGQLLDVLFANCGVERCPVTCNQGHAPGFSFRDRPLAGAALQIESAGRVAAHSKDLAQCVSHLAPCRSIQ